MASEKTWSPMDQNVIDLSMALYNEHRDRTGHNNPQEHGPECGVCLWLRDLMDRIEQAQYSEAALAAEKQRREEGERGG